MFRNIHIHHKKTKSSDGGIICLTKGNECLMFCRDERKGCQHLKKLATLTLDLPCRLISVYYSTLAKSSSIIWKQQKTSGWLF